MPDCAFNFDRYARARKFWEGDISGGFQTYVPNTPTSKSNMFSIPTPQDIEIITRIAVFQGLKSDMVERLISPASAVTLAPHQTLFRQDDLATAFFIMIDGWMKLYRITSAGEETVVNVLTRGNSYAEAHALSGAPYPATAEAVSDVRVVQIPAQHVVRCIRENSDIALAMIAFGSQHLHNLVQTIERLRARSAVQRVAEFLASLAPTEMGSCSIMLPFDKGLIAARLGLTRETLSRTFARLRSVGVFVHASHVAVKDVGKLRKLAVDAGYSHGVRNRDHENF